MSKNLYVGNLSFQTTVDDLRDAFGQYGNVTSAQLISDRETGRSRGFGFVEYGSADDANRAIESMNGAMLDGRALTVNVAREREGGGGGGGGGRPRGNRDRSERW